jgi:chemotaxis protein MotB
MQSEVKEDSYLASLSDLMVGLLFIFIIILMAFALNLREAESEHNQVVDHLTNNSAVQKSILHNIEQKLQQQGVLVHVDAENGVLRLSEALLFDSGQASFRPEGQKAIRALALILAEILPCYALAPMGERPINCVDSGANLEAVFIEGHTDARPIIGSEQFPNNWSLSFARAFNTYNALIQEVPNLDKLQNSHRQALISISAYEARRPVAPDPKDPQNRRIDLRFLMSAPSK